MRSLSRLVAGLLLVLPLGTLLTLSGCGGCRGSAPRPVLSREVAQEVAIDPAKAVGKRALGVQRLGELRDFESMPIVIDAMNDSRQVRESAAIAAREIVGAGIKFRSYDPPEKRRAEMQSVRRLYDLAQQNGKRYFIDLVPILLERMNDPSQEIRCHAGEDIVRLLGIVFDYRCDAPAAERAAAIARYREAWQEWQDADVDVMEMKRHPDKLRKFKADLLQRLERP